MKYRGKNSANFINKTRGLFEAKHYFARTITKKEKIVGNIRCEKDRCTHIKRDF